MIFESLKDFLKPPLFPQIKRTKSKKELVDWNRGPEPRGRKIRTLRIEKRDRKSRGMGGRYREILGEFIGI